MKQCPFCKEEIQEGAVKCKHCGSMIGAGSAAAAVPDELRKWNWAAFLWGPIWAIGHNVWIGLLTLVPYGGVVMIFVLGAKGSQWAWEKNHYDSIEQFKLRQNKWIKTWLIIFGGLMAISIILAILMPLLVGHRHVQ